MTSLSDLPRDVVLHILKFYLKTESQFCLMERVSKIDSRWKNFCLDDTLWIQYDGTLPFKEMMILFQKNIFEETKEFTFSEKKMLEDNEVSEIFSKLPKVEFLNFSNLEDLSPSIFDTLEKMCPNLCKIQFQNRNTFSELGRLTEPNCRAPPPFIDLNCVTIEYENNKIDKIYVNDHETNVFKRLNYEHVASFLGARGQNLLSIDISFCIVNDMPQILRCIVDCCPNLEQLYLIGVFSNGSYFFPTSYVQKKCLKLKRLHMDFNLIISAVHQPQGFPNLEEFSFFDPLKNLNDDKLTPILFRSEKLKSLKLPNSHIHIPDLLAIPAKDLECLNISNTFACNTIHLTSIMKKWGHSLKELDISFSESSSATNKAVLDLLSENPDLPLETLILSNTEVWNTTVIKVLENCHELKELNLKKCWRLDVNLRRVYYGKKELAILLETLLENKDVDAMFEIERANQLENPRPEFWNLREMTMYFKQKLYFNPSRRFH